MGIETVVSTCPGIFTATEHPATLLRVSDVAAND